MVLLQRYDPFGEIRRSPTALDRFWRGLGGGYRGYYPYGVGRVAPLDVQEDDDSIAEEGESDEGNYLVRERRNGAFHRAIRLPDTVDAENPEAGYEHGVLTVTFPKIEAKKARRVEVKVKS